MNILKKLFFLIIIIIFIFLIYISEIKTAYLTPKTLTLNLFNNGYFEAEGTWKAKNFEQGVYYTSTIKCFQDKKECIVASTDIDLSTKFRPVYINLYKILKWNDNEITAYTDELKFPQQLIINKKLKNIQTIMQLDNKQRIMTLENGSEIQYNKWNNKYTVKWLNE